MRPDLYPTSMTYEWDSHEKSHLIIFYSACAVGTHSAANGWARCCVSTAPDLLSQQDEHVGYFTALDPS